MRCSLPTSSGSTCSKVCGRLLDGGDVQAALVREGGAAHVGRVRPHGRVDHVGDEVRRLGEALELLVAHDRRRPIFELERRDDADEVGVAAALAVAVDGALHLAGAGLDRHQAVGHGAVAVVVGVDADDGTGRAAATSRTTSATNGGRLAPLVSHRQTTAAPASAAARRAAQRVVRVVALGVEEVLGVVDHALALRRRGSATESAIMRRFSSRLTRSTLLRCRPQVLPTMATVGVKTSASTRRLVVGLGRHALAPRHAEGDELRVAPAARRAMRSEELELLGVRGREAALDEVDAELVELERDAHLLVDRDGHALLLHAVAQRGVVELYLPRPWASSLERGRRRAPPPSRPTRAYSM